MKTPESQYTPLAPFSGLHPDEVADMAAFFEGRELSPVQLDPCTRITDPARFVETSLGIIGQGRGERIIRPYFERLARYREALKTPESI